MTSVSYSPAAVIPLTAMDAPLEFESPLSLLPPLSDTSSTPDSLDTAELYWPYDVAPDPNALHDFIFSADDERFSLSFDGDSDQPVLLGGVAPFDERSTVESAEDGSGGEYGPIARSVKGKRVVCQSACIQCRKAKTRCDGQRPCARCATHGRADECVDRPMEEIERGKQNRKRKPRVARNRAALGSSNDTTAGAPPASQQPTDPLPPSPPVSLFLPLDTVAARLAFGQSAILRQSIVDRINRMCASRPVDDPARCRFIRAVHLLLVKIADSISATHFDLFINGRLPGSEARGTSASLPACLAVWSRAETRPLYLDWTVSPTVCDPDSSDAVPTVRIRTGPAAQRILERWEDMQRATGPQQQPTDADVQDAAVQPIVEIFSCLGVADTTCSDAPPALVKDASSNPLHAPWCPVFSGVPLSTSSATAALDDTSAPPAPLPCVCFAATALPTSMIVNAAWERLFGYSQKELRLAIMRRGCGVMSDWYVPDSWWALHALLASHALTDKRYGYRVRAFVVVRTRWGTELPCMLEKRIVEEGDGYSQAISTITPLAQLTAQLDAQ